MYQVISTFDNLPKADLPFKYPKPGWMSSLDGNTEFTIPLKGLSFKDFCTFSFMAYLTGSSTLTVNVKAMQEAKLVVEWEFDLSFQGEWLSYRLPFDVVENFQADRLVFSFTFGKRHCVAYLGRLVIQDEDSKHNVLQAIKETFHQVMRFPYAKIYETTQSSDSKNLRLTDLKFLPEPYLNLVIGDRILAVDSIETSESYTEFTFVESIFPLTIKGKTQTYLEKDFQIFLTPAADYMDLTDAMARLPMFHINHGALVDGDSEVIAIAKPIKFPENTYLQHTRYIVKNLSLQINLYGNNNDLLERMWGFLQNVFSDFKRFLVGADFVDYSILGYQAEKPDDTIDLPTYSYDLNFSPYANTDYTIGRTYNIKDVEVDIEVINV